MWILALTPPCLPVQPCPQLLQPFRYAVPSAWSSFPHLCWLNFYLFFEPQLRHHLPWEASPWHPAAPCAYLYQGLITLSDHRLFSFLGLRQSLKAALYLVHLCVLIPLLNAWHWGISAFLLHLLSPTPTFPALSEYMPGQLRAKPSWPLRFIFMGIRVFSK